MTLQAASEAHIEAAKRVIAITKLAYPVGAQVRVTIGKAIIQGEVTGHSDAHWYDPGMVRIRNLASGKPRKFMATARDCDAIVLAPRP